MASISRTGLFNRALIKIGVPRIADPAEDSEPAHVCSEVYDTLVRAELCRNPWSFAIYRQFLAALGTPPPFGWSYQYELPEGFLRVVQIGDYFDFAAVRDALDAPAVPYELEGSAILTNLAAPLRFRFVKDVSDNVAGWHALFFEAMACRIGAEVCEPLTKSTSKKEAVAKEYAAAIATARRVNAIQTPPQPLPDNSWVLTRYV